jgi:phosphinothricin acetyltransferase
MPYALEPMTAFHRFPVMDIFNHYIVSGFAAYFERPLPYPSFERLLETAGGYPAFVARSTGGEIVGFALLRPYRHPSSAFRRTAEVTYFVHPSHARKGLGTMMLERLVAEARKLGVEILLASIASRNTQSLAFHQKNGFVEAGRFKGIGRKMGEDFDVVWMQKTIWPVLAR